MIGTENIILEGRCLNFAYPHQEKAIQSLNIRIRRGCRLALLGANGAGKSTLFLLLNGTLRPQSGKILIDDIDISKVQLSYLKKPLKIFFAILVIFQGVLFAHCDGCGCGGVDSASTGGPAGRDEGVSASRSDENILRIWDASRSAAAIFRLPPNFVWNT